MKFWEAMRELQNGKKICHPDEGKAEGTYYYLKDETIYDNDGKPFDSLNYGIFDGWEIWVEPPLKAGDTVTMRLYCDKHGCQWFRDRGENVEPIRQTVGHDK